MKTTALRIASPAKLVLLRLLAEPGLLTERRFAEPRAVFTPGSPGVGRLVCVPLLSIQSWGPGLRRGFAGHFAMMLVAPFMAGLVVLAWLVS